MSLQTISCIGQKEVLYAGTYSQRGSEGIYVYEFNRKENSYLCIQTTPGIENPNFLTIHPSGEYLYSVNTVTDENDLKKDVLSSFDVNSKTGTLELKNQKPTYGEGACHVSTDKTGRFIFVSHYSSGSLTVFKLNTDGSIGDTVQVIKGDGKSITRRQRGPHFHSALISPDNKFLYIADLGTDNVFCYLLDQESGKLTPSKELKTAVKPGAGPRHFDFHPSKSFLYLAQELNSTLSVLKRNDSTGELKLVQNLSTLPEDFEGRNLVADIHVSPNGKSLFVSNRGHNSIAVFNINENGIPSLAGHEPVNGDHPRNFLVDLKGEFLLIANQNSDNISRLSFIAQQETIKNDGSILKIPSVVCLKQMFLKSDED